MRTVLWTLIVVGALAAAPRAQQVNVRIAFGDGRVTVEATDALVSDVLAEWSRVGGTLITGVDRIPATRLTLKLVDIDEWSAMTSLVGKSTAILAAARDNAPAGASRLTRLVIPLPNNGAPAAPAAVIDKGIPESRFEYVAPLGADDGSSTADKVRTYREVVLPAGAELPLMPEMRFQYMEPMAPPRPEAEREDKAKKPEQTKKQPSLDR